MVSLSEIRELLLALALIAGFSGALAVMNMPLSFSFDLPKELPTPVPSRAPRVANPVVHIVVPEHNIFAPQ